MITRNRVALFLLFPLLGFAACQKVPLLAPSGSTIILTTAATALPMNGTADIIAQLIEPSGTPPQAGTRITFTTTIGTVQPSDVETDINGRAVVRFSAGTASGTATIAASSGGASTGAAGSLKITVGAAGVGRIALSANPGTVAASGGTSAITASVTDPNGNALSGVPVTFTVTAGSFSATATTTDAIGNAQTILTTNRTATVTATAGVQGSTGTVPPTGGTTSTQQSATVTVNVNAVSAITVTAPTIAVARQPVTFGVAYTQNANGSPVSRVVVDFGDGSNAETIQGQPSAVSHTYSQAGSYTVRVTAFDTFGDAASGSATVTVTVKPQLLVTISAPSNPTVGTVTVFTIAAAPTSGNVISSTVVDFGDGTKTTLLGNATSVQHVYSTAATYTVTVSATDSSGATGSASTTIVPGGRAGIAVLVTGSSSPIANSPVTFTIAATPTSGATITSIVVSFGDGTSRTITGNTTSVQHTYSASGSYTVTATATDATGATGSGSTGVVVGARPPLSVTVTAPTSANANSAATFTIAIGALSTGSSISSIVVNFGDGSSVTFTSSTTTASRTYTAAGTYVVTVTATDTAGASGSGSTSVVVGAAMTASFTYSASLTGNRQIAFNGTSSTGNPTTFTWDYGDGSALESGPTSTHSTRTHAYSTSTTYVVRLTVSDTTRSAATTGFVAVP